MDFGFGSIKTKYQENLSFDYHFKINSLLNYFKSVFSIKIIEQINISVM